jgi:hypothetical protein
LLDYAIENGVPSSEEAYKILSKDIESALNRNSNPNDGMSLLDPKFQTNLVNS